ncbi:MAG: TniQ family protein [Methylovirgula sp.]|uniref:TniQ family protein n=1 Tax=Methylovirgula sp. TaxID=1978224 RepID=UPI00307630E6
MTFKKDPTFEPLGLPLWAAPSPEEPAHGLLLRLTQINCYPSVQYSMRETGLSIYALRHGWQFEDLARLTRSDVSNIARDSFRKLDDVVVIRGEKIGKMRDRDYNVRRVCPSCLRESLHHRFFWDLSFFTHCPRHKIKLIDHCTCELAQPLTWRDGRLHRGNCCRTGDLRTIHGDTAQPDVAAMEAYLAGRLGICPRIRVAALDELDLVDAIDLLERVGALDAGGYAKNWRLAKKVNLTQSATRARAYRIITEDRFQEVLDKAHAGFRRANPNRSGNLSAGYGWFYHWYNYQGGKNFSPYLAEQIVRHASRNFYVGREVAEFNSDTISADTLAELLENHENSLSLSEASRITGLNHSTFPKLARALGLMEAGRARPRSISKADVSVVAAIWARLIDREAAGDILGLARGSLHGHFKLFVRLGLLMPFIAGPPGMGKTHRFLRDDIEAFCVRARRRCEQQQGRQEDTVLIFDRHFGPTGPHLLQAILSGDIVDAWIDRGQTGIRSISIRRSELVRLRKTPAREETNSSGVTVVAPFDHWRMRAHQLTVPAQAVAC